jgi:hypothetical protein
VSEELFYRLTPEGIALLERAEAEAARTGRSFEDALQEYLIKLEETALKRVPAAKKEEIEDE